MPKRIHKNKLDLAILAALFLSPTLVHHSIGQIPLVSYEWIADSIGKLQTDFQKIEKLYSETDAIDFQIFYITGMILSNINAVGLLLLFIWQMKGKTFFDGIGSGMSITKSRTRRNIIDSLIYLAVGCLLLFLYIWVFPTWISKPGPISLFEIRPGFSGEWINSVFFAGYSFFLPLLIVAFTNFVMRWNND